VMPLGRTFLSCGIEANVSLEIIAHRKGSNAHYHPKITPFW
jgi:hypothetical protein